MISLDGILKIANFAVGLDGSANAHRPLADMRFKPTRECPKGHLPVQKHRPGRVMKSDFQKVKTEHFRAFVPEELQSVERQDVLRTASGNEILKDKRIKKSQMDIANMSRPFAFQIVLLENLNGIEVRRIGQIGQIGEIGRIGLALQSI